MKITLCVFSAFFFLTAVKAEAPTNFNYEEISKQIIDFSELIVNEFGKITGIKTEFDKTKLKSLSEEIKKKSESTIKNLNELIKGINNPEIQAKTQKLLESTNATLKKLSEQIIEILKSSGIDFPATVQKSVIEIFDELTKTTHKVQEKVNQILADLQAELKKKKPSQN